MSQLAFNSVVHGLGTFFLPQCYAARMYCQLEAFLSPGLASTGPKMVALHVLDLLHMYSMLTPCAPCTIHHSARTWIEATES